MRINKKFGEKIFVEWHDAYTDDGWKTLPEMLQIDNTPLCFTNAWYIAHDKDFLIVCHTKGKTEKNCMMGKLVIPRGWIKAVK